MKKMNTNKPVSMTTTKMVSGPDFVEHDAKYYAAMKEKQREERLNRRMQKLVDNYGYGKCQMALENCKGRPLNYPISDPEHPGTMKPRYPLDTNFS